VATGKATITFEGHTKGQNISCVLVSPDGKVVASGGSNKKFFLWDAKTGKEIFKLDGHTDLVRCLAFTPDGKTLLSGSWDGTVRVWDVATGKEKSKFTPKTKWVEGLDVLPDGKRVLVACDEFSLWDFTTGERERKYETPARVVARSPDGKKMVAGFYDGKVRLLEVETGKQLAEYQAHIGHIHGLHFSADGKWFSTAGGGGYENNKEVKGTDFAVRVWPVEE
jgi:WD40 repeat protein